MSVIKRFIEWHKRKKNPIGYWRSKGVKIGNDMELHATAPFGSEPYLIEIGDHVRINAGVRFITHDGGYGLFVGTMKSIKM